MFLALIDLSFEIPPVLIYKIILGIVVQPYLLLHLSSYHLKYTDSFVASLVYYLIYTTCAFPELLLSVHSNLDPQMCVYINFLRAYNSNNSFLNLHVNIITKFF